MEESEKKENAELSISRIREEARYKDMTAENRALLILKVSGAENIAAFLETNRKYEDEKDAGSQNEAVLHSLYKKTLRADLNADLKAAGESCHTEIERLSAEIKCWQTYQKSHVEIAVAGIDKDRETKVWNAFVEEQTAASTRKKKELNRLLQQRERENQRREKEHENCMARLESENKRMSSSKRVSVANEERLLFLPEICKKLFQRSDNKTRARSNFHKAEWEAALVKEIQHNDPNWSPSSPQKFRLSDIRNAPRIMAALKKQYTRASQPIGFPPEDGNEEEKEEKESKSSQKRQKRMRRQQEEKDDDYSPSQDEDDENDDDEEKDGQEPPKKRCYNKI